MGSSVKDPKKMYSPVFVFITFAVFGTTVQGACDGKTVMFPSWTNEKESSVERVRRESAGMGDTGNDAQEDDVLKDLDQLISSIAVEFESNTGVSGSFNQTFSPPVTKAEGIEKILEDAEKQFTLVTGTKVSFLPGGSCKVAIEGYIPGANGMAGKRRKKRWVWVPIAIAIYLASSTP